MHLHDINNLLNLQEITVTDYLILENQSLILTVQPVSIFQNCFSIKSIFDLATDEIISFSMSKHPTLDFVLES